jgi:hypothetical protein
LIGPRTVIEFAVDPAQAAIGDEALEGFVHSIARAKIEEIDRRPDCGTLIRRDTAGNPRFQVEVGSAHGLSFVRYLYTYFGHR